MAQIHSAHVAPWKKDEVQELVRLLRDYPVIGIARVGGIPAAQMVKMRKNMRDDAEIKVVKNTLAVLALKEAGRSNRGLEQLVDKMEGPTAIIATKINPFRLYKKLESSKTKAPAKGGDTAPEDISVQKGETPFKPGPIVGELQKAGIPAKIDQGKVMISADKVLVKAGDKIPQDVAQMLTRLEIFPMIVGMDVRAIYEGGTVYGRDSLSVDYTSELISAHHQAINLAVFAGITEPGTITIVLASSHAKALGLASVILEKNPEALGEAAKAALANRATAAPTAAASGAAKEEEKKEEAPSEEEAMAGLGSLFG